MIGRFMQEDTYRGDGLNLYAYCANNPVMYYDPSGHDGMAYSDDPSAGSGQSRVEQVDAEVDNGVNAGNGGLDFEGGASNKILSSLDAEEMAFKAIHGSDIADTVVLGKYGDGGPTAYTNVAKDMDAQFFQLDNWDEIAKIYSDDEIWKINEKFLDIQTSSGREIYLSHNPVEYINGKDFYSRELRYLVENGYTFVKEGDIWHAVR